MDERKPGDMGRYGDAGDRYWCRDCQDTVWSPVQHDNVHANYEATGREGESLNQWNRRMIDQAAQVRRVEHLTDGELAQAAWLRLTEYLGDHYGLHPPEARKRNIDGLIGMCLPTGMYDWCMSGLAGPERMLDQLHGAATLINDEIARVTAMLEEQERAAPAYS